MAAGQPTSDNITAVRHVSAVWIHTDRYLLSSRNYDLALEVRVPFSAGERCLFSAEQLPRRSVFFRNVLVHKQDCLLI